MFCILLKSRTEIKLGPGVAVSNYIPMPGRYKCGLCVPAFDKGMRSHYIDMVF